jgi:hypothetical protein
MDYFTFVLEWLFVCVIAQKQNVPELERLCSSGRAINEYITKYYCEGVKVAPKKLCENLWFFGALLMFSTVFNSKAVFASSDNWVEVATFTESDGFGAIKPFVCNHVDWRIKWQYSPSDPHFTVFTIDILSHEDNTTKTLYTVGDDGPKKPTPAVFGQLNKTGTCYVTGHNGSFSLSIFSSARSFTIVIEENLDSVPEFSSFMILPLFLVITLFTHFLHKKERQTKLW